MYYPRATFNNRHEKIRVSKDSVFNLLKWATRFAFAIPQPAFTFHQTLTFPANVQDAKEAKTIFNKFLKSVFKRFGDDDLAAFYVIESSKSQRIHFHVCFSFFNFNNLPFAPSKMAKEFRADLFKRWNALNGDNCVNAANCLKDRVFDLKAIAYFVKTLRIPAKPDARPETIFWGIRGKATLLKYSQKSPRELLNQSFDSLFKDGRKKQKKVANFLGGKMDIPLFDRITLNPDGRDNLVYYLPPNNSRYRNNITLTKLNGDNSDFDLRRDLQKAKLQESDGDSLAF